MQQERSGTAAPERKDESKVSQRGEARSSPPASQTALEETLFNGRNSAAKSPVQTGWIVQTTAEPGLPRWIGALRQKISPGSWSRSALQPRWVPAAPQAIGCDIASDRRGCPVDDRSTALLLGPVGCGPIALRVREIAARANTLSPLCKIVPAASSGAVGPPSSFFDPCCCTGWCGALLDCRWLPGCETRTQAGGENT